MDAIEPSCQTSIDYFNSLNSDIYQKKYIIHIIEKYENKNEEKENYINDKNKFEYQSNYLQKKNKKKDIKAPIEEETPNANQSTGLTPPSQENNVNNVDINFKIYYPADNVENKKENKMLNLKRRNQSKDKGKVKNIMLNVYKSNFFREVQNIAILLITKTEYYKKTRKNLNKINNKIYIEQKGEKNLELINKRLKDILSDNDKNNKDIIDKILENDDNNNNKDIYSLKAFLNEYIKDLMFCFSCNKISDINFDYKLKLNNKYKDFIGKLKNKKSEIYINRLESYIKNIKKTFEDMKDKGDQIRIKKEKKIIE